MENNSKIRPNEYWKLGRELAEKMYRKDIGDAYTEFIKDENISHDESIIVREYAKILVSQNTNNRNTFYVNYYKDSYYHLAEKFHNKIALQFTNKIFSLETFQKKYKMRLNETILLSMMCAEYVTFQMTIAQLKNS